jgi:hypothetical protein
MLLYSPPQFLRAGALHFRGQGIQDESLWFGGPVMYCGDPFNSKVSGKRDQCKSRSETYRA